MVLIVLGTQSLAIGGGWVNFDPVTINSGREYVLLTLTSSSDLSLVYSSIDFRYGYSITTDFVGVSSIIDSVFPDSEIQFIRVVVPGTLVTTSPLVFQARRTPIFSNQSVAVNLNLTIAIDPDVSVPT